MLRPGITIPTIALRAANLDRQVVVEDGRPTVFLFCPSLRSDRLHQYCDKIQEFASANTQLITVVGSPGVAPNNSASPHQVVPLICDAEVARYFGVRSAAGSLLPSVFLVDEERLIRRVWDGGPSGELPPPAAVLRAVRALANIPKPPPLAHADWHLGPLDAGVSIIEYSDYQCGHCAEVHRLLEHVRALYKDKIVIVHRHFPLKHSHPLAELAAEAAEAAGAQGRFWEMHWQLFAHTNELSCDCITRCAQEIGLDGQRLMLDLETHVFEPAVQEDFAAALSSRVKFPPAVFVNRIPFEGPRTVKAYCEQIDTLLACTPFDCGNLSPCAT